MGDSWCDDRLAFSIVKAVRANQGENPKVEMLSNDDISPHFEAAVQATEEAIINCLVAAESMTGTALPHCPTTHSRRC